MGTEHYPMSRTPCGAQTRGGANCHQPAMKNGRCRLHGGKSKSGKAHGRYKHGERTKESIAERRWLSELLRNAQYTLKEVK